QEIQQHLAGTDCRQRVNDPLAGIFRSTAANWLEHTGALRVDVAAGGDAHAALHHSAQIGDDIAKHVVGHDNVEPFRVFYEPHCGRIHVSVITLDVRVILG